MSRIPAVKPPATLPPAGTYRLPAPATDGRFTYGLVFDVADVLARHGFPLVGSGPDLTRLMQALFAFLYDTDSREGTP